MYMYEGHLKVYRYALNYLQTKQRLESCLQSVQMYSLVDASVILMVGLHW